MPIAGNVKLGKDVVVGRRVRIQTFVVIGDGTTIEDYCFIFRDYEVYRAALKREAKAA